MQLWRNISKISVAVLVVILLTSIATIVVLPSAKAALTNTTGQAGVVAQADTTYPASSGYPNLGPLPAGVTPAYSYPSQAFISVTPSPIGVGQNILINIWTSPGMYHAFYMQGYTVNIKKPDGTTETLGPVNSYMGDASYWWTYTVDQVGTWQFQFVSPGTYMPAGNYTDSPTGQAFFSLPSTIPYVLAASIYYEPSTTPWYNVTVQQQQVLSWPPATVPGAGDYWSRPINPMNREWYSIAGNFPYTNFEYFPDGTSSSIWNYKYTPYVQAPNSAHILWMKQNTIAGLIGGVAGISTTFSGGSTPAVIYDGRCYQTYLKNFQGKNQEVLECYDLQTGQIFWDEAVPSTTVYTLFGPMTQYIAPQYITYQLGTSQPVPGAEANNGYSVRLVYIGSSLIEWDPYTGAITLNASLPSYMQGNQYQGGNVATPGNIFYNDPYCISYELTGNGTPGNPTQYFLINWTIAGYTGNVNRFPAQVMNNVSWTAFQTLVNGAPGDSEAYDFDTGVAVLGGWNVKPGPQWCIGYTIAAADMKTGKVLFNKSSNDTATYNVQNGASLICHDGMFAMDAQNGHWNCFDERTGNLIWTSQSTVSDFPWNSSSPDYPWGNFWAYYTSSYDINSTTSEIIACSYAGLFAFNWANGHILWHYFDNNTVPFESPYGGNSFFTGDVIADGKVYSYAGEHTPSEPINRGVDTVCLNATTGQLIWRIHNTMVPGAVSDGYLCAANQDDGYMYVFGIGKSATTVTTPDTAVPQGTPVVIKGTVLDESPAQPGTPCVSDASMAQQMEYLHMQQPLNGLWRNTTMTGVPVILTAIDSKNNVYDIGTTTTNPYYGTFGMAWTPPSADTYTITASFAGSYSYGSSSAGTTLVVSAAASATPTPTPTPPAAQAAPDYTAVLIGIAIAMIAAVAIVGIILYRKKP